MKNIRNHFLLLSAICLFLVPYAIAGSNLKLQQADTLYSQRNDSAQAKASLDAYAGALKENPTDIEALWKSSRAAWWVGEHSAQNEKAALFQKGIDWAKEAIRLNPDDLNAHFWLGANYGTFGEAKGVLKSLFLVKPIRQEMEEIIKRDSSFMGGAAYRVLGVVDYKVPGIAGGSQKRALENLTKAATYDANNPFNQYYLADYFANRGEKDKAREHLSLLNSLSVAPDVQPDLLFMQEKGRRLAQTLK
jgi:tetratricopeptide (TPR) repeat protein